jgi:hypothetical protein
MKNRRSFEQRISPNNREAESKYLKTVKVKRYLVFLEDAYFSVARTQHGRVFL